MSPLFDTRPKGGPKLSYSLFMVVICRSDVGIVSDTRLSEEFLEYIGVLITHSLGCLTFEQSPFLDLEAMLICPYAEEY